MLETADGGIVILGGTNRDPGLVHEKIFVMKLDSSGTELWNYHFD